MRKHLIACTLLAITTSIIGCGGSDVNQPAAAPENPAPLPSAESVANKRSMTSGGGGSSAADTGADTAQPSSATTTSSSTSRRTPAPTVKPGQAPPVERKLTVE